MKKLSDYEKDVLKQKLPEYMATHGIQLKPNKNIHCINPAHNDTTPSMGYKADQNYLHCFSCGESYDIFAACEALEGIPKGQGINRIKELYGYGQNTDRNSPKTPTPQPEAPKAEKPKQTYKDFTDLVLKAHESLCMHDYHAERGISEEVATRFKLGYVQDFKGMSTALVIPILRADGSYSYQLRNINKEEPLQHYKPKVEEAGEAELFNSAAIKQNKPVAIVEGAIDALSVISAGMEAIALNGAQNKGKLYDLIQKHKTKLPPIILALDNDEAGRKAQKEIKDTLDEAQIASYGINLALQYKDPNEALQANPEAFKGIVSDLTDEESIKRKEYLQATVESQLEGFLDFIKTKRSPAISTGFESLDEILRGGLREGLICIGGISSLGKTTLALQIMDNIAKQGQDVLIFSLEMSAYELRAKTIARESLNISVEKSGFSMNAVTTTEILDRVLMEGLPKESQKTFTEAYERYLKYAKHIFIHEAVGKFTVNDIKARVEKHIKATGITPVVLVDYLQILQPAEQGMSDKNKVSYDVLMLKQLSRDYHTPVMVISSFNRDSYEKEASFSSFKESGEIEYSADVLMALQLTAVRTKQDTEEALLEEPRKVDVKVLKNRGGTLGTASFNATLAHNSFEEMSDEELEAIRKRLKK
ncbi:DnaB-like helicase C-terminal domain-containing protein [Providencia stuartii]|uniref:DnaB-like helicase C-terminal domain-containing protein n=1 Tax=Providencia stuartii TaxID=588 RepID=UPI0024AB5887|nr:DnaB-like helicase C-terminal domain-containing protein [Providencia stuartii]MCX3072517.1 toprim domain-containing protein [Providencia stuartii]